MKACPLPIKILPAGPISTLNFPLVYFWLSCLYRVRARIRSKGRVIAVSASMSVCLWGGGGGGGGAVYDWETMVHRNGCNLKLTIPWPPLNGVLLHFLIIILIRTCVPKSL